MTRLLLTTVMTAAAIAAAEFPSAEISNGAVTVKFYVPDAKSGYYRGTRFDWSGVIPSLRTKNHEYFGQWFEKYDPKLHDAIQGPVDEFKTNDAGLGYAEAKAGGTFIRIGVGVLRKPEEEKFNTFKTYDIVDGGKWKVRKGKDWIEFTHELRDKTGYGYRYTKRISLAAGAPEMVIAHTLKNTGKKRIETSQYNHNFFVMDGKPTGPDASVKFPFELKATKAFEGGRAETRGGAIAFLSELQKGQSVYGEFAGYGSTAADYDLRVEHQGAGAGVRIRGDQPLAKVVFWSIRTTFCPEPYITVAAEPGQETRWQYRYEFYDLKR